MPLHIELQNGLNTTEPVLVPSHGEIAHWLHTCIQHLKTSEQESHLELTVRFVEASESQRLNRDYRGKDKPTNVLSFPFEMPEHFPQDQLDHPYLGDLAICADIVSQEATQQNKAIKHHWAHMCIHGFLHLLGYDHIEDDDAEEMESLEKSVLAKLDIDDPYRDH